MSENLEKFAYLLGCTDEELSKSINRFVEKTGHTDETVYNFLKELHYVRHENKYYLIMALFIRSIRGYESWGSHVRVCSLIEGDDIRKYEKIVADYNNISVGMVLVSGDIATYEITELCIEVRNSILGIPYRDGISLDKAKQEHMEILNNLEGKPNSYFKKLNSSIVLSNCLTCEFEADETKLKSLFDFEISTDKKNDLEYMGIKFQLEAGRGYKWFLRHGEGRKLFLDKLKQLFINHCGINEEGSESS